MDTTRVSYALILGLFFKSFNLYLQFCSNQSPVTKDKNKKRQKPKNPAKNFYWCHSELLDTSLGLGQQKPEVIVYRA